MTDGDTPFLVEVNEAVIHPGIAQVLQRLSEPADASADDPDL